MRKILFLALFCIILVFSCILCGISGGTIKFSSKETFNTQTEQPITSAPTVTDLKEPFSIENGSAKVIVISAEEQEKLLGFSSSDENIVTVDDGGRVDAKSEGTAKVTALFADNKQNEYTVTVTKPTKKDVDKFSTSINANQDILENNIKKGGHRWLYTIKVNRKANCVTVYTFDENGEYTIPVRAMVCSCGKNNGTITGNFGIYFKNEWHALYDGVYGHYVSGISGDYLFHSVPYYSPYSNQLEVEEFNKLGTSASLGCVRLAISDTKWIYDNCTYETPVVIYDDDNPGPLGKPKTIKITDKKCGWDPTDNNKNNPYNKKAPVISGAKDCTVQKGGSFNPLDGVKAVDTCSNDITDSITVVGNVITSKEGTYKVTYSVTDVLNRSAVKDITVTVK